MDSDQEKTINEIIHEYLAHSKYPLAMAAFEKESESKGLAIPSNSNQQMNEERISNIQVRYDTIHSVEENVSYRFYRTYSSWQ